MAKRKKEESLSDVAEFFYKNRNKLGWIEGYNCGCSMTAKRKKDLLGYCGQHGDERRELLRTILSDEDEQ